MLNAVDDNKCDTTQIILEELCGRFLCLMLAFKSHNPTSICITTSPKVCKEIIKNPILLKSNPFTIITEAQENSLQTIPQYQANLIGRHKNIKLIFLLSVSFALGYFSIKLVQNFEEFHKYGYSRMEEPNGYWYPINLAVNEANGINRVLRMFYGNNN